MGPTNVALVKLFRADRALREAQERLEAATKNVRVQERRVTDLAERIKLAHTRLREQQSSGGQLELDVKTREARIEKLRAQQAITRNNKEYQTFLIEINTEKVDRGKAEDELIKVMEAIEKGQAEIKDLTTQHDAEQAKFTALKNDIGQTVIRLQAQVDELRPAREAAAGVLPPRARQPFERLAERYDGEAMGALAKPDRRREEYLCTACNMDLVPDVYNRLHSRDDMVCCPSCGRILYIPEELPPEVAINSRGKSEAREPRVTTSGAAPRARRAKGAEKLDPTERRAKGRFGRVLDAAQGESVKIALDAGEKPVECDVTIDGRPQGVYKGRSAEHLHRIVSLRIEEAGLKGAVEVHEKPQPPEESPAEASASASDTPEVVAAQPADEQGMAQQGIGQAGDNASH
ncbi:MAG TPA: C4-type zinc ribbon domain-containing protein [Tepidisphaeraceae bacterium]|nr:C4-type zinc ribbon domain-containing protein [Tepidisphaeraceae bacterium]